jgi:hypothetical protein
MDLPCRDFQTSLSYVAVSRVKTIQGLMLDAPFDRGHMFYETSPDGMKMKLRDQELMMAYLTSRVCTKSLSYIFYVAKSVNI